MGDIMWGDSILNNSLLYDSFLFSVENNKTIVKDCLNNTDNKAATGVK